MQSYTWEIKPILHGCRSDCGTLGQLHRIRRTYKKIVEVDIQAIYWSPWHTAQHSQSKTDVATMQGQATTLQPLISSGGMAINNGCYMTKLCGK